MEISTNTKRFQRDLRAIKCYHKHFILFFFWFWKEEREEMCGRKQAERENVRSQKKARKATHFSTFSYFLEFFFCMPDLTVASR